MEINELKSTKRIGRPPSTGSGQPVTLRMHSDVLDPLDAWISGQSDPTITRQQAILTILRQHLKIR